MCEICYIEMIVIKMKDIIISELKIFRQFVIELVFISIPAYIGSYFLAVKELLIDTK